MGREGGGGGKKNPAIFVQFATVSIMISKLIKLEILTFVGQQTPEVNFTFPAQFFPLGEIYREGPLASWKNHKPISS